MLKPLFGWPFDTTLAMCRLVFGGIFERFPNLKIITHHAGAMISFFSERLAIISEYLPKEGKSQIKRPVLEYFKKFYNDTVTGWTPALECARAFFGYDHLIFATDYPFGPERGEKALRDAIKVVNELRISEEERKVIFEENAKKLFRL